jgi:hypothetical protein
MSLCTLLSLCILAVMIVLYTSSGESYVFLDTLYSTTTQVNGVPFRDQRKIMLSSALQSGMITPDAIMTYLPAPTNQGQQAYYDDASITNNTLELSPTFQQQRLKLASANTNFIPPKGIQDPVLWIQRTTLDKLDQPGFTAQPVSLAKYPYF